MMDLEFHPAAERYDLLEGAEYENFRDDIKRNGQLQPILFRLIEGGTKRQGIDGRNRLRACNELGIAVQEAMIRVSDDAVESVIDSLNLFRRHQTPEQRAQLIMELRSKGMSIRDISAATGASKSTVHRTIAESRPAVDDDEIPYDTPNSSDASNDSSDASTSDDGVLSQPGTVEPEKVKGTNGKTYSASKPKPKKTPTPAPGEAPADDEQEMVDEDGYAVPGRFRAVFAERKNMRSANAQASRLATLMSEIEKGEGYKKADAMREERLRFSTLLISLANLMRNIEFHSTHRECNGDGCEGCDGKGWLMAEEVESTNG